MFYKRLESFRYTFGTPPEIYIRVLGAAESPLKTTEIYGLMLDVSPKGAKLFSERELQPGEENVSLEFVLNHETICSDATIVWKQQYEEGWMYGADFERNSIKEMLILNEIRELKEIEMK